MPEGPAWSSTSSALYSSLMILNLVDGKLPIPPHITHVAIEIGCNGHDLQWLQPPPKGTNVSGLDPHTPIRLQKHVLLIAFEPLLDKWAGYLTTQRATQWKIIEKPHQPGWAAEDRLVVLPFALHPNGNSGRQQVRQAELAPSGRHPHGENSSDETTTRRSMPVGIPFNVAASDGCSSFLKQSKQIKGITASGRRQLAVSFLEKCSTLWYRTEVPAVSLETVIGEWLGGRTISFVKIDAEGFDLEVAKSVGSMANRVRSFTLEVTGDKCTRPLQGISNRCSDVVSSMRELGFSTDQPCALLSGTVLGDSKGACQGNMVFNAISP
ncbi:hypothetical protein AB1Y20_011168 [Prymnesium parvum]|uniref:Methyltransferase FkbM domain-containing protein n=1 Tax=Prymnesium parvum TaxID=97485 RepID=A0AB34IM51_PRYPA